MDFVDAFLWVTAISYFICVFLPQKPIENLGEAQRLLSALLGAVLTLNLLFNIDVAWIAMTGLWTAASLLSYLDYVQWGKPSRIRQMYMAAWDLLISVCCLVKL